MLNEHPLHQYFGRLVIEQCRDRTIQDFDLLTRSALEGKKVGSEFKEFLKTLDEGQRQTLRRLIIEMVDNTLHNTLFMFEDYDNIRIAVEFPLCQNE